MAAAGFSSDIQVEKAGKSVNGKSVIKLLALDCRNGDEITIVATGIDEAAAVDKLKGLVQSGLGE
jgi:phosphocarrier protein